jgi:hypothetical protein
VVTHLKGAAVQGIALEGSAICAKWHSKCPTGANCKKEKLEVTGMLALATKEVKLMETKKVLFLPSGGA